MTYFPTRFAGMSCSSSGPRLQQRPRPPRATSQPAWREEAPAAAAADAGVAGSGAADADDVAAAAAAGVAGGRSSPDTGTHCTGPQASAP